MSQKMKRQEQPSNTVSAILGAILLLGCFIWLGWLLLHQQTMPLKLLFPRSTATVAANNTMVQVPPLLAEGITLGAPGGQPALSQQQALALAAQLEPDAAAQAKTITASYVLLNYPNVSTPATHANLNNVPAWMIWYQKIPYVPADASVDPTPFPHSYHDLYVFIDATSGKELLAVWA
jgi:hypothetical protein